MTTTELPRASRLWKSMSEDRRFTAAMAFWADEHAMAEQAEVVGLIARQINFRPHKVIELPVERRTKLLVRMATVSDAVAGRLLVAYHLDAQRPMMGAFLDALGIAHDTGLITADEVTAPAADALASAVTTLRARYAEEDVTRYLQTLLLQDPDTWGGLRALLTPTGATT